MAERATNGRGPRAAYDVAFYMPWIGPLLAPGSAPPPGGAETQIFLVAQALAARGLRVGIIAFDTEDGLPARVGTVDIIARPPYDGRTRLVGKVGEAIATGRTLRRIDVKVIAARASGPQVGILAVFARLLGMRFVYSSAHVVDFTLEFETRRRNRLLYLLGLRLADTIVVQTEEQVQLCRHHFGREPVVVNSIAQPLERAVGPARSFVWIGRIIWYKRPLKFLDLAARMPEAHFKLVGVPAPAGSEAGLYKDVVRRAAELPNVEFVPHRSRTELLELLDEAVAVVNTADSEGMPNIFLEGWAKGVPALALAHDPDDVITTHGLGGFAGGTMDGLVDRARELWEGRDDRDDLSERCLRYVETHHSAEGAAQRWHAVIEGSARALAGAGSANGSRPSADGAYAVDRQESDVV